jgi:dolichol-phosphate mannosyltransferase
VFGLPGPVWVILPTYNERENLAPLVRAVRARLEEIGPDHVVLIVDDSSPDGTGELADSLAGADPNVRVLHRPAKRGLGQAYIAGFREALAGGAALVFEMDADFSHDPSYLPAMISTAGEADLVLGSRYVPGGGVRNWGPVRRIISQGGCWYARRVLGVPVRDLTGGFKCFRRDVLEAIDLDSVRSQGYAFQVEMTYRALQLGFRVAEVGIVFSDRRVGASKMSRRIVLEAIWMVPRLRFGRGAGQNRLEPGSAAARSNQVLR